MQQKALISEIQGWVVFYNHRTGKAANLLEEGGVYSDLHAALHRRAAESNMTMKKLKEKQAKAGARGSKL